MMHDEVVSRLRHILTEGEIAPGARSRSANCALRWASHARRCARPSRSWPPRALWCCCPIADRAPRSLRKGRQGTVEVCEALEATAGELACPRISDQQLQEIAALQLDMSNIIARATCCRIIAATGRSTSALFALQITRCLPLL